MAGCPRGLRCAVCGLLTAIGLVLPATVQAECSDDRRMRLKTALQDGFGVQYWGDDFDAATLADQPHGLLVLELSRWSEGAEDRFSREEIARISRDGHRPVLGYLNIAEVETFRDFYPDDPPSRLPPWWGTPREEDHLAAYWTPEWHALMEERVDQLIARGVDGIFLDDALHYYTHMQIGTFEDPRDYAVQMMELVIVLAARARRGECEALVVVNNAVFVGNDAGPDHAATFDRYRTELDGLLVENALATEAVTPTRQVMERDYAAVGIPVLTIDVVDADGREAVRHRAQRLGFAPYLVEDDRFNLLAPPVPAR